LDVGVEKKGDSGGIRCTWALHEFMSCRFIPISDQSLFLDASDRHLHLTFVLGDWDWPRNLRSVDFERTHLRCDDYVMR
jgi:hypothetical protein